MNMLNNLSRLFVRSILLFLLSMNCFAVMYKWVDADGNVQYTQSPPPEGVESATIKPPPAVDTGNAIKQLENQKQRADQYLEDQDKQKEEKQTAGTELAQKKALCEQAKARVASYERPRVNIVAEDGTRTRAPEETRLEELKKSKEDVDKYCGS